MAEMFTAMIMDGIPLPIQRASCCTAVRSTHSPMGRISPLFSAIGMNSAGDTMPSSGCCQRSKASTPMIRSDLRLRWGW